MLPRYFFHVRDGCIPEDEDGLELTGMKEARVEAVRAAAEILRHQGEQFCDGNEWKMEVTDESKRILFTVRFSGDDHDSTKAS
jgi:hypothetical protein